MVKQLKFFTIMALSVLGGVTVAQAQTTIAAQTCDTQIWSSMEARARLETEREIMQNQNLIFKPDSVLAYTCFDSLTAHVSRYAGSLFTHTNYFGGLLIPWGAPYGMDNALQTVVIDAMDAYMDANFPYSQLGGRGENLGAASMAAYATQPVGNQGRSYACGVMNEVWRAAKCMDFIHNNAFSDTDGYYPFANLTAGEGGTDVAGYEEIIETRKFPAAIACPSVNDKVPGGWESYYRLSRNESPGALGAGDPLYAYHEPLGTTFLDVSNKLLPGECGAPIRTGVEVMLSPAGGGTYPDGVCTNPGCSYTQSGTCARN